MLYKKLLFTFLFLIFGAASCRAMNSATLVGRCITAYVNHVDKIIKDGIKNLQPSHLILKDIKDTVPPANEGCISSLPAELIQAIHNAMVYAWARKTYSINSAKKTVLFYDARLLAEEEILYPSRDVTKKGENSLWYELSFEELYKRYIRVQRAKKSRKAYPYPIIESPQAEENRTTSPNTEGSIPFLLPL